MPVATRTLSAMVSEYTVAPLSLPKQMMGGNRVSPKANPPVPKVTATGTQGSMRPSSTIVMWMYLIFPETSSSRLYNGNTTAKNTTATWKTAHSASCSTV